MVIDGKKIYDIGEFSIASLVGEQPTVPRMRMIYSDDVINVFFVSIFGSADIHQGFLTLAAVLICWCFLSNSIC